jgi:hypothetical protein
MMMTWCCHCQFPLAHDMAHLEAPVLKGACHCGSSEMQELLVKDMTGDTCRDLWLVTCGLPDLCEAQPYIDFFKTPLIFDDRFFLPSPHATQGF